MAGAIAEAPIKGVGRTLTESGFVVPSHQGNYRWKEDEVKDLFDDVIEAMKQDDDAYFLGMTVFMQSEDGELIVLDGQQRLATSIMILSAIRAWLKQYTEYQDLARQISENFIGRKELGESSLLPRLSLNVANHEIFEKYVVNEIAVTDIRSAMALLKRRDPNRILLEAALYCHRRILEVVGGFANHADAYKYLLEFVKYLRDNVFVISLMVSSEANAYTIFETLNDRGMELSPLDLVNNYLFGRTAAAGRRRGQNPQLRAMEGRWVQMLQQLANVDPGAFLRAYWTSRHGRVQRNKLFENLKDKHKSADEAVNLSVDMLLTAEQYSALDMSDDPLWGAHEPRVRETIRSLKLLGGLQTRPVLLAALAKLDRREFDRLAWLLETLIVKYQLVGGGRTGALEISCARLARMIFNEEIGSAAAAYQELRDIYPSDDEFRASFQLWEEDDNAKATYVLRKLEMEARRVELGPNYKDLDPGTLLTLEHIFPRNPTPEWKEKFVDDEQADEAIYRLGNLCLVGRNRDLGRELFSDKKEIFGESDLYLTNHLKEYDDWDMSSIEKRQIDLAKHAIVAWRFQ